MLIAPDYSQIEIFIIEDNRNLPDHNLQHLINGDFEAEIQKLRAEAKPFFEYIGLDSANSKM
jgi:hypothetical protein